MPFAPIFSVGKMLAYALDYGRRGWRVLPLYAPLGGAFCTCGRQNPYCGAPGKHPRTRHGVRDASADEAQIRRWWTSHPHSPIGIATGIASGMVAIDIDPRNGGVESMRAVMAGREPLPPTPRVLTGGGGEHLYFAAPATPLKSRGNVLGHGIDICAEGHYVVAPPSEHASGERYTFFQCCNPAELDLAPMPAWLLGLIIAGTESPRPVPDTTPGPDGSIGWLAAAFSAAGWLGAWQPTAFEGKGSWWARCPWCDEHTDGRGRGDDSSCVIIPPSAGRSLGWWLCSHSHCGGRTIVDVRQAIPVQARAEADRRYPPQLPRAAPTLPQDAPEAAALGPTPPGWHERLQRQRDGTVSSAPANLDIILRCDDRWADVLRYDAFADRITITGPPWAPDAPARSLDDDDAARLSIWLSAEYSIRAGLEFCFKLLVVAAHRHTVDPLRDYLTHLTWDGHPRLATWTSVYLGAADTPYHQAVGRRWMIGAVERALSPGCQMDAMLVLEGAQNIGKSRACRILGSDAYFCDEVGDLRNKDSADSLMGKWIVELSEMASVRRADVEVQKSFLSRRIDHFRPAYGRTTVDRPRRCVFVATTNSTVYHTDATGGRRFWCVRCGRIDLTGLATARDQLWAESVVLQGQGEPCWLQPAEEGYHRAEIEERADVHPWTTRVLAWVHDASPGSPISISRVLRECLEIEPGRQAIRDAHTVADILRSGGWTAGARIRVSGQAREQTWNPPTIPQS